MTISLRKMRLCDREATGYILIQIAKMNFFGGSGFAVGAVGRVRRNLFNCCYGYEYIIYSPK